MVQFEAKIQYAGKPVKIVADSFEELHTALAGIEELGRDADFLRREKGAEGVVAVYREDSDENKYFGLQDSATRQNVTYGTKRGEAIIPFFPKGEGGFYSGHSSENGRGENGRSSGRGQPRRQPPNEGGDAGEGEARDARQQVMKRVQKLGREMYPDTWKGRWKQTQEHYGRRQLTLDQLVTVHRRLLERQSESEGNSGAGDAQAAEPKGNANGRAARQDREALPY